MEESLQMEGLHFDVIEATLRSIATRTITPIVKEELKLKIQSSRLAAGKSELPKPLFKEPEKCTLTPEELEKRKIKREKNRLAAGKCRMKKKEQSSTSVKELGALIKRNEELKTQLATLEKKRSDFMESLDHAGIKLTDLFQHEQPCQSKLKSTPLPSPCSSTSYAESAPFVSVPTTVQELTEGLAQVQHPCGHDLAMLQSQTSPHSVHGFIDLPFQEVTTNIHHFAEFPTQVPFTRGLVALPAHTPSATSVQTGLSEYTEMTPLPQQIPPSRRASYDVTNDVTPMAQSPFIFPSTSSTAWWDMPEQLCAGEEHQDADVLCHKLFEDGFATFGQMDEDILVKDEEEAMVPGHGFSKATESPSFY